MLIVANVGDEPEQEAALTLSLPDPLSMSSCLPFDVSTLADMPVAFAGTVTGVDKGTVTIEVDRWFKSETSETSDVVQLSVPAAMTSAALDGVDFEPDQRYLVTATNGIVNGCGFSGSATPDLEAAFEQAFPE